MMTTLTSFGGSSHTGGVPSAPAMNVSTFGDQNHVPRVCQLLMNQLWKQADDWLHARPSDAHAMVTSTNANRTTTMNLQAFATSLNAPNWLLQNIERASLSPKPMLIPQCVLHSATQPQTSNAPVRNVSPSFAQTPNFGLPFQQNGGTPIPASSSSVTQTAGAQPSALPATRRVVRARRPNTTSSQPGGVDNAANLAQTTTSVWQGEGSNSSHGSSAIPFCSFTVPQHRSTSSTSTYSSASRSSSTSSNSTSSSSTNSLGVFDASIGGSFVDFTRFERVGGSFVDVDRFESALRLRREQEAGSQRGTHGTSTGGFPSRHGTAAVRDGSTAATRNCTAAGTNCAAAGTNCTAAVGDSSTANARDGGTATVRDGTADVSAGKNGKALNVSTAAASSTADEEANSKKQCVICLDDDATLAVDPCGHLSLCEACSHHSAFRNPFHDPNGTTGNIRKFRGKCPECRGPIKKLLRIYT